MHGNVPRGYINKYVLKRIYVLVKYDIRVTCADGNFQVCAAK